MIYKFGSIAFFSLLTGVLTSMLTSAGLSEGLYRWDTLEDISSTTRVCCSSPNYLDSFAILRYSDSYAPPDHSLSTCFRDLENGLADVVVSGSQTLQAALNKNSTRQQVFSMIPSSAQYSIASAFSGEVHSNVKGTFEQAIVESKDIASALYDEYFSSTGACTVVVTSILLYHRRLDVDHNIHVYVCCRMCFCFSGR